jgi:hypothetical protein
MAYQELHQRRLRRDQVPNRIKRCRSVKDRRRLWQVGGRDRVRALCCAHHDARFVCPLGSRYFNRDKLTQSASNENWRQSQPQRSRRF